MDKQLLVSTGIIKNASGSAYVELGNMKILCSVQGPRDSFLNDSNTDQGIIKCDFKYAPFAFKGFYKERRLDKELRSLSSLLEKILVSSVDVTAFPKSVVEIYFLVLEVDGDPLCLATMCASLALANAGIHLFGLIGSCCVAVMDDGSSVVNPTSDEMNRSRCYTTLSILNSTKEVVYINHSGAVTPDICSMNISRCIEEGGRLCSIMRGYLLESE